MKREVAILGAALAVIGAVASILSAHLWVVLGGVGTIGLVFIYLLIVRLTRKAALVAPEALIEAPYTLLAADESDIRWAAATARRVYTGIDVIPGSLMLEWFQANPKGFNIIKDRNGHLCGNVDILPLKPDTLSRFLDGTIIEQNIRGDCLYHPDESQKIADLYVESVVAIDRHSRGNPFAVQAIITGIPDMLKRVCPNGALSRVYAIGGSKEGIRLMQRLGFDMISAGDERKDKHKVFCVSLRDLLKNISSWAEVLQRHDGVLDTMHTEGTL